MESEPPLLKAAQTGDEKEVQRLLQAGTPVDTIDRDGQTSLHRASRFGNTPVIEKLLQAGIEVDKADRDGWTALQYASCHGHASIVEKLLQAGATVDKADNYTGWTALYSASCNGFVPIVRRLLQAGAAVDKADKYMGWTPLYGASSWRRESTVTILLQAGANPIPLFHNFPECNAQYAHGRETYLSEKRENQWQTKRLLWIAYNKEDPNKNPLASLPLEMILHICKHGLQTLSKQEWDEWQELKEDNPEIKKLAYKKTSQ